MFNINIHRKEYHHDFVTVISKLLPEKICAVLRNRVNEVIAAGNVKIVNHKGLGNSSVSDGGGQYLHHIFQGQDVRDYLPELVSFYHSLVPLVGMVTCLDAIASPHDRSDINIKVYPAGGGTLGLHRDTNGITVLLFLTTNKEAPLRMQIPRTHPSKEQPWVEHKKIYANAGDLLIMRGRDVLHDCEPTITEQKMTVVLNFYDKNDTWRPAQFDSFVYDGVAPDVVEV
jgi:hypothetical protein